MRALIGKLKQPGQILLESINRPRSVHCRSQWPGPKVHWWLTCRELAMRRIADLHAGEAKTDARNAYIIEEAARACSIPCAR